MKIPHFLLFFFVIFVLIITIHAQGKHMQMSVCAPSAVSFVLHKQIHLKKDRYTENDSQTLSTTT